MDYLYSRKIIDQNNLIPRKISKKIINFINFPEKIFQNEKDIKMSKYITYDYLCDLRKKFQKFKKGRNGKNFRNYYVYEFIKKNYSEFSFNYNDNKSNLDIPEINGLRVSLSSLLLEKYRKKESNLKFKTKFYTEIKLLFLRNNFKKPKQNEIDNFFELILNLKKKKEKLYIVTPCCPDYSKIKKGERYEFTFNRIESGPGIVAERLRESIKEIHQFLKNLKVDFEHYITIGDFEAFGANNQKRLGLSEKEYLHKIKINQIKIKKLFKNFNCETTKTFTQIFGNKTIWNNKVNFFKKKFNLNEINQSVIDSKTLESILGSRISLYKKWYGDLNTETYKKILFDQASEYASMGFLINKKFENSLILGADHYRMSKFYKIGHNKSIVFYLKKNYLT